MNHFELLIAMGAEHEYVYMKFKAININQFKELRIPSWLYEMIASERDNWHWSDMNKIGAIIAEHKGRKHNIYYQGCKLIIDDNMEFF